MKTRVQLTSPVGCSVVPLLWLNWQLTLSFEPFAFPNESSKMVCISPEIFSFWRFLPRCKIVIVRSQFFSRKSIVTCLALFTITAVAVIAMVARMRVKRSFMLVMIGMHFPADTSFYSSHGVQLGQEFLISWPYCRRKFVFNCFCHSRKTDKVTTMSIPACVLHYLYKTTRISEKIHPLLSITSSISMELLSKVFLATLAVAAAAAGAGKPT